MNTALLKSSNVGNNMQNIAGIVHNPNAIFEIRFVSYSHKMLFSLNYLMLLAPANIKSTNPREILTLP